MKVYFLLNIAIHFTLLSFVVWSIIFARRMIWPPPKQNSWQYFIYWGLFYISIILDIYLMGYSWNSWSIPDEIRYFIGLPLLILGSSFSIWSIFVLGVKNTTGLEDGFIVKMPYKITRNPQYLGDIVLLIGLILLVNSLQMSVLFILEIIIFILMPIPEELWLEGKYGEEYIEYKKLTSRFL